METTHLGRLPTTTEVVCSRAFASSMPSCYPEVWSIIPQRHNLNFWLLCAIEYTLPCPSWPTIILSLSYLSSLQVQRSVLMAHLLQALIPQVALPCQVGKWHCPLSQLPQTTQSTRASRVGNSSCSRASVQGYLTRELGVCCLYLWVFSTCGHIVSKIIIFVST